MLVQCSIVKKRGVGGLYNCNSSDVYCQHIVPHKRNAGCGKCALAEVSCAPPKKRKSSPRLKCKGHTSNTPETYEFECDYDTGIDCVDCVIYMGTLSPQTGKPFRGNFKLYEKAFKKKLKEQTKKPKLIRLKVPGTWGWGRK